LTADQVKEVAFVLGKEIKGLPLTSFPECTLKPKEKREKMSIRLHEKSQQTNLYIKSRWEGVKNLQ
jgi:hypothetical protein